MIICKKYVTTQKRLPRETTVALSHCSGYAENDGMHGMRAGMRE